MTKSIPTVLPTPRAETPATPEPVRAPETPPAEAPRRLDPTRYGDWELKGRCIDF